MASLSHAPFATPNTQQLSPSHKLLPSHLSMDPASSSLSTLTQPFSSEELTSWLQKPNAKLSYNHLNTMSSFHHPYEYPSYNGDLMGEAVDSVEQGFIGGDDPLLTSSWDALDKLVSASMTISGSGIANELPEFAYSSAQGSTLQRTSPSSMTAVEQKPFNVLNGSNYNQKGNMWGNHQSSTNNSSTVGLNLASLISADPGFVERAAKFSSYSQQAYTNSLNQSANNIISINNALSLENFNLDCVRKLSSMNAAKASCINGPVVHRGDNVAMDLDANSDISVPKSSTLSTPTTMETKQSISPQRSMANISGSKKKREGASKDGELDDAGGSVGRKKAKGGEKLLDEDDKSNVRNVSKVGRGDPKTKMQQSGESNSVESEQKSGGGKEIISKPNGTNTTTTNNGLSSSQAPKPDFIHVRARRGQATDSHSLAERVRREKISERMKYLQDLVPGCTKVTGKAMMLDEIINYVQSLQRQVEFLSMKLAAVHPSKLEFNFESLFGKEVVQQPIVQNNQSVSYAPETHANLKSYPLLHENLQQIQSQHHAFPESNPPSCMHSYGSDAALRRTLSMLAAASSDVFGDQCISSQITDSWDEDLQNIVQLGFPQTPLNVNPNLQGALLQGQMKTEL